MNTEETIWFLSQYGFTIKEVRDSCVEAIGEIVEGKAFYAKTLASILGLLE